MSNGFESKHICWNLARPKPIPADDKIANIYYFQKYTRMTFYDSHNSSWQPIKLKRFELFASTFSHILRISTAVELGNT